MNKKGDKHGTFLKEGGAGTPGGTEKHSPVAGNTGACVRRPTTGGVGNTRRERRVAYRVLDLVRGMGLGQS